MKSKLFAILLAASVMVTFTACGDKTKSASDAAVGAEAVGAGTEAVDATAVSTETGELVENELSELTMEDFVGFWDIDPETTNSHFKSNSDLRTMFGSSISEYGASVTISEDQSVVWYIGASDFAEGYCELKDGVVIANVTETIGDESVELSKELKLVTIGDEVHLVIELLDEDIYWTKRAE